MIYVSILHPFLLISLKNITIEVISYLVIIENRFEPLKTIRSEEAETKWHQAHIRTRNTPFKRRTIHKRRNG